MPDLVRSATADATGTAVVTITEVPAGLVWIASQNAVEAITTNVAVTAVLRKNGRYITSTNQGQASSASGPPYLRLFSGDALTMTWSGLNPGDTAILTMLYTETDWHNANNLGITVV